jgi:prophage antirepressor-like protein
MNNFKKDRAMSDHEGQTTTGQRVTLPVEFKFESHAVRTVMVGDEILFVAADVCEVLGIKNPTDAIGRRDEREHPSEKPRNHITHRRATQPT